MLSRHILILSRHILILGRHILTLGRHILSLSGHILTLGRHILSLSGHILSHNPLNSRRISHFCGPAQRRGRETHAKCRRVTHYLRWATIKDAPTAAVRRSRTSERNVRSPARKSLSC